MGSRTGLVAVTRFHGLFGILLIFTTGTMTNPDVARVFPKPNTSLFLSSLGLSPASGMLGVFSFALYVPCAGQRGRIRHWVS